jgi:hypothetical protein
VLTCRKVNRRERRIEEHLVSIIWSDELCFPREVMGVRRGRGGSPGYDRRLRRTKKCNNERNL